MSDSPESLEIKIKGYNGQYSVTSNGLIISNNYGGKRGLKKYLKPFFDKEGYHNVSLCRRGLQKTTKVHRLVAKAFVPNARRMPQVNHINGVKTDNRSINLEWCTNSHNMRHAYATGLSKARVGGASPCSKKIKQLTLNGDLIKIWPSMADANRHFGKNKNINTALSNGYNRAYGFQWVRVEP